MPRYVRQFIYDSVQGVLLAVIALNIAIPGSLDEARAQALIVASAILRAAISAVATAAARAVPAFLADLASRLDVDPETR